jgi:hypothetical protein
MGCMNEELKATFKGEVMLAGWSDSHNGGAKLAFWLPDDADLEVFRQLTVRKGKTAGHRFMCLLFEIDEQELMGSKAPEKPKHHLSSDAHLMITGEAFVSYVNATVTGAGDWDADKIRKWVKWSLGIVSLSQLDSEPLAAKHFHDEIREPFNRWNNGE